VVKNSNGQSSPEPEAESAKVKLRTPPADAAPGDDSSGKPSVRRGTVAKVSHTLSVALAERLEEFAFYQRVSESAVIEYSLTAFFSQSTDDAKLGEQLRRGGAGRRRKSG
jgi:hypothetical protein